eukprot:c28402_g1_i2 orf=50-550(+)
MMAVGDDSARESVGSSVQWQWCTDSLQWMPYSSSSTAIIESAFSAGRPFVCLQISHAAYTVSFQPLGPRQTAEHPTPGKPYIGTLRVAYLPRNKDGEEVLDLLKKAWSRRLLFRVGTSVTTGQSDVVVWSGIHHKTRMTGGSSNHGYPDENYFERVKKELADVGVI